MVKEFGPAVVLIQTLPKAVSGVLIEREGTGPLPGVTDAQVVPTLISSISIKGVLVALSWRINTLAMLVRSVPTTAVASAVGSVPPIAVVLSHIRATSFPVPAIIS